MKKETDEFSFILKPSEHGIGVFAAHDIAKGARLALFSYEHKARRLDKDSVPELFRGYCIEREGGKLACLQNFNHMSIGWYLNHSKDPNAKHTNYVYHAAKNINKDEEILIDYNTLEEPKESRDHYYNK